MWHWRGRQEDDVPQEKQTEISTRSYQTYYSSTHHLQWLFLSLTGERKTPGAVQKQIPPQYLQVKWEQTPHMLWLKLPSHVFHSPGGTMWAAQGMKTSYTINALLFCSSSWEEGGTACGNLTYLSSFIFPEFLSIYNKSLFIGPKWNVDKGQGFPACRHSSWKKTIKLMKWQHEAVMDEVHWPTAL